MSLPHLLPHCTTLSHLQAAHAASTTSGFAFLHPSSTLTSLLHSLALLRPLPLPYALLLLSRLLRLPHSFPLTLSAASRLRLPSLGRAIHAQSLRFGFASHLPVRNALISLYSSCTSLSDAEDVFFEDPLTVDVVSHNTLINGYAKAGALDHARQLFNEMPQRDAVSYGTMIGAHSRCGQHFDALKLFDEMRADGLKPDNAALVSALSSCAQVAELERGKSIHDYVRSSSSRDKLSVSVVTALVDMYAKCGEINAARKVFDESPSRNLFTWNSIIVGLAMHGCGEVALDYFDRMRAAGVRPDGITFLGVLVACSHSGFVKTARRVFGEMERVYGVRIELKHYGCMADLFGRAGMIEEAMEMIEGMPMEGDGYVWGGVLAGCRIHRGNVEVAEIAARKLLEIDSGDTGVYSIMARIYADARRWEDVERIRRIMEAVKVKKNVGFSLVQLPRNVSEREA